ncbi:hypothetical protein BKA70DRAFT_1579869 [Coprinopsis sp. MPI-PUGE-AT-0042]|nr:hypothetical protein BKA70DRAFT_1579869 [Coprinopsis sp. MPI-PUGE-AT-0042]
MPPFHNILYYTFTYISLDIMYFCSISLGSSILALGLLSILIPLVPMITLLVLKLRGWCDHRKDDTRPWMREKVVQDEEDIEEMLRMAADEGHSVRDGDREWWYEEFVKDALDWIEEYVENWPETEDDWQHLGFFDLAPTHHDHSSLEFALLSVRV